MPSFLGEDNSRQDPSRNDIIILNGNVTDYTNSSDCGRLSDFA